MDNTGRMTALRLAALAGALSFNVAVSPVEPPGCVSCYRGAVESWCGTRINGPCGYTSCTAIPHTQTCYIGTSCCLSA